MERSVISGNLQSQHPIDRREVGALEFPMVLPAVMSGEFI